MKVTQKKVLEVFKETEIWCMSFENGRRHETYGRVDILTALEWSIRNTRVPERQMMFFSMARYEASKCMAWELANHRRVGFAYMRHFALFNLGQIQGNKPMPE
jgi:hypothetical protein